MRARDILILASGVTAMLSLAPAMALADPDDHPTAAAHEHMENARDRFLDRKQAIADRKQNARENARDSFQDRRQNVRVRMEGVGEERREAIRHHLTNVKQNYQEHRENIRDRAHDRRDKFQDRKEDIRDKDRGGEEH